MKTILALFAAIAALAACSPATTATTETTTAIDQPMPTDVAPYIAVARVAASAEMEALARGKLEIVDGCVRLKANEADAGSLIVWPYGTTADASTGAVRIRNGANDLGVGDQVELSGGGSAGLQADALAAPAPAACTGPYWIAGSSWRTITP